MVHVPNAFLQAICAYILQNAVTKQGLKIYDSLPKITVFGKGVTPSSLF